jgi:outer membrane receptor for ferrienterochelin and colicin
VWKPLDRFSLNSNASFIDSKVTLYPSVSRTGSTEHPLQGQAGYLMNVGLGYAAPERWDAALLFNAVGRRLRTLAYQPLPDIYEEPYTSLDASFSTRLFRRAHLKATGKNLLDPQLRWMQGHREVSAYHSGRSFTIAVNVGS